MLIKFKNKGLNLIKIFITVKWSIVCYGYEYKYVKINRQ